MKKLTDGPNIISFAESFILRYKERKENKKKEIKLSSYHKHSVTVEWL